MQDGSKHFDDIMKNKLKGLSMDASPSDWIMMERMLEWEGLTKETEVTDETRFDEIAHDKLNNIPSNEFVPDWDRMSAMIDDMNEEPSMEPSEFDQAIENQLKKNIAPTDQAGWDRLEPILEADRNAVVSDLDALTKEKLTQVSEIQPAWGSMNAKINRELFLPESIVKYKVIEAALILLFAISASQLPLSTITEVVATKKDRIEHSYAEVAEQPISTPKINQIESKAETISKIESTVSDTAPSSSENQTSNPSISSEQATLLTAPEVQETISAIQFAQSFWNLPPTIGQLLEELKAKPRFSISEYVFNQVFEPVDLPVYSAMTSICALEVSADKNIDFEDFGKSISSENINDISGIGMSSIEHAVAKPFVEQSDLALEKSKVGLMLGVFSGSDYNEIITPFDPLLARQGSTQWSIGYAGGVSLGMRFKQWELETGAIYSSNQYTPDIREISGNLTLGYSTLSLKDIELDIVKVPLNFRFNVNLWDKWKVYALSGATMNMVMQSEFVRDAFSGSASSFAGPPSPVSVSKKPKLLHKDFREGLLEGGTFKNNSYFTANLGFGVERTLGTKWSVFAQPTYQRQIFSNGIGPNQDRYNSISLYLGTRVAINSKSRIKKN